VSWIVQMVAVVVVVVVGWYDDHHRDCQHHYLHLSRVALTAPT
jgi:hypothetical protein